MTLLFLLLSHPRRPLHLVRNHSILIFNCSLSLILPIGILVLSFRLFIDRQPARTTFPLSTHPSSVLPFLCFQSLLPRADAKGTAVKYSKPFVLITIRNAGGCGYSPSSYRAFPRDSRSLRASAYSVPLRYCFLFFPPPITGHGSLACNCFRTTTWEPLATVDSKPLTQTLSLLESTLALLTSSRASRCLKR